MQVERITITVDEAAELLGISRALAYNMAHTGKLPALRFGRRFVIPKKAVEAMLESTAAKATELILS